MLLSFAAAAVICTAAACSCDFILAILWAASREDREGDSLTLSIRVSSSKPKILDKDCSTDWGTTVVLVVVEGGGGGWGCWVETGGGILATGDADVTVGGWDWVGVVGPDDSRLLFPLDVAAAALDGAAGAAI